ncbi:MAG TPA: response regulator transcription factor, partial [Burkholderiales bacterium]
DALRLAMSALEREAEVSSAGDLEKGLELAAAGAEFDLVLLDLGLPGCTGLQALERFRERQPALPVVVFSASSEPALITGALDRGAMGYIPKTAPREVLVGAVRLVISGGVYVPAEARSAQAAAPARAARPGPASASELRLSGRQSEVLSLLLKGLPNKLIAQRLNISENTTKIHVSAVLHALGVSTRTEALVAASRLGLRLDA